jgi:acetylglutamate kinase
VTTEGLPHSALIKYGGNAMIDPSARDRVLAEIARLHRDGVRVALVHGGGPAIGQLLDEVGIEADFVGGHRYTDARTMRYVEMALRGLVNGELVRLLCAAGRPAIGLSGKDAALVRARRRWHQEAGDGAEARRVDLGQVGDVAEVRTALLELLLDHGYLPVLAPIAGGEEGGDYNVNADMFAGHVAAALHVDVFVALTDVDGLRRDPDDPGTVVRRLAVAEIDGLLGASIVGGMIPKIEACAVALRGGVPRACIVDGTRPGSLRAVLERTGEHGTEIRA